MKIFGHPIHILLVHFPAALIPLDFLVVILSRYINLPGLLNFSFYSIVAASVFGWMAVVFGAFDLLSVYEKYPGAVKHTLWHGGLNILVITTYSLLAFIQYKHYPNLQADSISIIIIKALMILLLIIGNFIGGNLILKHKVGIENE